MKNNGALDLMIAIGWTIRRIQKLIAVKSSSSSDHDSEIVFYFVSNSKEEAAPPPHDQQLALDRLVTEGVITLGKYGFKGELVHPTLYFELTEAEPQRVEIQVHRDAFDELADRPNIQPFVEKSALYSRVDVHFDQTRYQRLQFFNDSNPYPRLEYRDTTMKLKSGTRYFAVMKVLFDYDGPPLDFNHLRDEVNKQTTDSKGLIKTPKDFNTVLGAIKKGLKSENDGFFPIRFTNKSLYLEQKTK